MKWSNYEINFVRENIRHSSCWIQHYIKRSSNAIRRIKMLIRKGLI